VKHNEAESATMFRTAGIGNSPSRRVVAWTVWGIWAVMTIAALAFVWRFGNDVPFWDEWNMVNALTGAQPITIKWLWALHNGHRILEMGQTGLEQRVSAQQLRLLSRMDHCMPAPIT
jgi:hypothetical protein